MSQAPHTRYAELIERASFDLKLARDLAVALKLSPARLARLNRAARELRAEQTEQKKEGVV
jgi:hypothetical protein